MSVAILAQVISLTLTERPAWAYLIMNCLFILIAAALRSAWAMERRTPPTPADNIMILVESILQQSAAADSHDGVLSLVWGNLQVMQSAMEQMQLTIVQQTRLLQIQNVALQQGIGPGPVGADAGAAGGDGLVQGQEHLAADAGAAGGDVGLPLEADADPAGGADEQVSQQDHQLGADAGAAGGDDGLPLEASAGVAGGDDVLVRGQEHLLEADAGAAAVDDGLQLEADACAAGGDDGAVAGDARLVRGQEYDLHERNLSWSAPNLSRVAGECEPQQAEPHQAEPHQAGVAGSNDGQDSGLQSDQPAEPQQAELHQAEPHQAGASGSNDGQDSGLQSDQAAEPQQAEPHQAEQHHAGVASSSDGQDALSGSHQNSERLMQAWNELPTGPQGSSNLSMSAGNDAAATQADVRSLAPLTCFADGCLERCSWDCKWWACRAHCPDPAECPRHSQPAVGHNRIRPWWHHMPSKKYRWPRG